MAKRMNIVEREHHTLSGKIPTHREKRKTTRQERKPNFLNLYLHLEIKKWLSYFVAGSQDTAISRSL